MFNENQKIGNYTLIKKLGKGGFGEVWLAEKSSQFVTKRVAVKLPLNDQVKFEAIRQEATLWEQASGHANVLPIIDADVYDGQVVIVSEYADGGSLAERLNAQGRLSVQQAVEMTIGILNGLQYLHTKGIIHRDIKPQNILLQGETPRLADFGISRAMQTTAVSSTIVGTDAYMSPETFEGSRSVQTDIWAVGVVLYQLLTGNLPFPQDHPTERMFAILMKDFVPLPEEIPSDLQNIVKKALAKNPHERFQTASEMSAELKDFLYKISSPARQPNLSPTMPVTQLANQQHFPPPKIESQVVPETIAVMPPTAPQQAPPETLIYNPVNDSQLKSEKAKKPFLIIGAVAVALLFVGILAAGYFTYQKIASVQGDSTDISGKQSGKTLKNISAPDMELLLEDSPPEQLKALSENPAQKRETANSLKQLLAIAAEAEAEGYTQKAAIKIQLEFIEKQMVALAYEKRKAPDNKTNSISTVSDTEAKAFLNKPGNEQKFNEFVESNKQLELIPKDKQLSEKDLAEAKLVWAKTEIAFERATAEKASLSERERRKIELRVELQKAQFLAQQYSKEFLAPKIVVTAAEIEDYKKQHPALDTKAKKAKAEEILQRVKKGEDFAKLADEFSEDPGTKNKGGLYENVKKGQFDPNFEQAALALSPGQITDKLVETSFGYHIIQLVGKGDTYDVRHIMFSKMISDPDNPAANVPVSADEAAKTRIEKEKEKKLFDELIVKHKITVAEDFKVPPSSTK